MALNSLQVSGLISNHSSSGCGTNKSSATQVGISFDFIADAILILFSMIRIDDIQYEAG